MNLPNHGDETKTPILADSENLIREQGSGWAPSVWDLGGTNDFYTLRQNLGGASGPLGLPMADAYTDPQGVHQVFQNGRIDNGIVSYSNCNAGRFANGGQSTLGCPFDNGGGVFVHYWSGPQANVQDYTGGSFVPAVMVDGPYGTFFVNYGFRTSYISGGYAATCLAPADNAYSYNGGTWQDFANCYMTWTPAGGVVVHLPAAATCTNSGGPTITGPNACAGFATSAGTWFSGGGVGLYGQRGFWARRGQRRGSNRNRCPVHRTAEYHRCTCCLMFG